MRTTILLTMLLAGHATAETITSYCACAKVCCGPNAKGITAAGTKVKQGRTIAAPRNIPLGTRVRVEGIGEFTVEDRTARRYDGRWDIYFDSHKEALKFGKQERKVTIIK